MKQILNIPLSVTTLCLFAATYSFAGQTISIEIGANNMLIAEEMQDKAAESTEQLIHAVAYSYQNDSYRQAEVAIQNGANILSILEAKEGSNGNRNWMPLTKNHHLVELLITNAPCITKNVYAYLPFDWDIVTLCLKVTSKQKIYENCDVLLEKFITTYSKHNEWTNIQECCFHGLRLVLCTGGNPNALSQQHIYYSYHGSQEGLENKHSLLIVAARRGEIETVKALLFYGADITYKDREGKSAYDHCGRNSELKKLLAIEPTNPEEYNRNPELYKQLYPDEFNLVKKYPQEFRVDRKWYENWQKEQLKEKHGSVINYLSKRELGQK